MAASEVILGQPYDFFVNTDGGANAQTDATVNAPSQTDYQHIVQGIEFSESAAPAAAGKVQLIEDAAGTPVVLMSINLPAALIGPVSLRFKGVKVTKGKSITLRVPALGGTTVSSATIMGMTRPAQ